MFKYFKAFAAFLLPIIRKAAVQIAADELSKKAYPERRPRTPYSGTRQLPSFPQQRAPRDRVRANNSNPPYTYDNAGFHDVLLVAFDVRGRSRADVESWLADNLPDGDSFYGEVDEIHLESWWIADDNRTIRSDTDSAVFVKKGKQTEARNVLRTRGLSH